MSRERRFDVNMDVGKTDPRTYTLLHDWDDPDKYHEEKARLKAWEAQQARTNEAKEPQVEREEPMSDLAAQDLEDFGVFTTEHEREMAQDVRKGWTLQESIYDKFYSEDMGNRRYRYGDPQTEDTLTRYHADSYAALDYLKGVEETFPVHPRVAENGFLYVDVNDGVRTKDREIGRFYFNLKPEHAQEFLKVASKVMMDGRFDVIMKIPFVADVGDLNRADKLVLYVNSFEKPEDEALFLEYMAWLQENYLYMFQSADRPKMTEMVKTKEGGTLTGVAFGQEPGGGASFGQVRSRALGELYTRAQREGKAVNDPRFERDRQWENVCDELGIDAKHPAFNKGTEAFSVLRGYIGGG